MRGAPLAPSSPEPEPHALTLLAVWTTRLRCQLAGGGSSSTIRPAGRNPLVKLVHGAPLAPMLGSTPQDGATNTLGIGPVCSCLQAGGQQQCHTTSRQDPHGMVRGAPTCPQPAGRPSVAGPPPGLETLMRVTISVKARGAAGLARCYAHRTRLQPPVAGGGSSSV